MNSEVRLSCMLKYSPEGKLIGKDVLFHTEQKSIDQCFSLLGDFRRKFNINSGLPEVQVMQQTKPKEAVAVLPANSPKICPDCGAPLVMRTCSKPGSKHFGKTFMGCCNFKSRGCLYSYWPK